MGCSTARGVRSVYLKPLEAHLANVHRFGHAVNDQFGQRHAGRGRMHDTVSAPAAVIDKVRQPGPPSQDRIIVGCDRPQSHPTGHQPGRCQGGGAVHCMFDDLVEGGLVHLRLFLVGLDGSHAEE